MTTNKVLRFPLFLAIFLALTFPSIAPAQTFSVEQQSQIQAIIQQITDLQIQLLLARITELQTQIAELLAKQVTTEQKVETVIQQTAPVLGSIPVPPIPISVSYGTPTCKITQEKFGNLNNTGVDGYADVYNIAVPVTFGDLTRVLEQTEVNLPNHTHKDRTATSTQSFTFSLGSFSGTQVVTVPPPP